VDVSGGEGGLGQYYKYDYASGSYTSKYTYDRNGGDGGDGRLVLEGPQVVDATKAVDFRGCVAAGTSLAISGGDGTTDWAVTSDTKFSTDSTSGLPKGVYVSNGKIYCKSFSVASNVTLTISGSKPFIVYASGDDTIAGTIDGSGTSATNYTATGSYSSTGGFRPYAIVYGGAGVGGGKTGGANATSLSYVYPPPPSVDGMGVNDVTGGTGAGKKAVAGKPWNRDYVYDYTSYGSSYYYEYWYFAGSGGGGASATDGEDGHTIPSTGWLSTPVKGISGAGGSSYVDIDKLTSDNIQGGAGGGGGGNGGYAYSYLRHTTSWSVTYSYGPYHYGYGTGSAAGGGGAAVAICASGSATITGEINVKGGDGGDRNPTSYTYIAFSGAGGGAGAGNVLLEAKKGFTLGAGAVINASGGEGGQSIYDYSYGYTSGTYYYVYDYKAPYSQGGDGGDGAIVLRSEKMPEFVNIGNADLGLEGTFHTDIFRLTKDGVSTWQDAGVTAPEFKSLTTKGDGTANLYIEGAQVDPMTGKPDLNSATGWVEVANLSTVSGYRFFRVWIELKGSSVSGKVPEIDSFEVKWSYKK
jgi:hypothetical protein